MHFTILNKREVTCQIVEKRGYDLEYLCFQASCSPSFIPISASVCSDSSSAARHLRPKPNHLLVLSLICSKSLTERPGPVGRRAGSRTGARPARGPSARNAPGRRRRQTRAGSAPCPHRTRTGSLCVWKRHRPASSWGSSGWSLSWPQGTMLESNPCKNNNKRLREWG